MDNVVIGIDIVAFAAVGLAALYGHLFPSTPITESATLAAHGQKLRRCSKRARRAWKRAGAAMVLAERLIADEADPCEISSVNLRARAFSKDAELAKKEAFSIKKKIVKQIAYMKSKFGDLGSTKRAVERSGVWVAMAKSMYEDQEERIEELMRSMGLWNWYLAAVGKNQLAGGGEGNDPRDGNGNPIRGDGNRPGDNGGESAGGRGGSNPGGGREGSLASRNRNHNLQDQIGVNRLGGGDGSKAGESGDS